MPAAVLRLMLDDGADFFSCLMRLYCQRKRAPREAKDHDDYRSIGAQKVRDISRRHGSAIRYERGVRRVRAIMRR